MFFRRFGRERWGEADGSYLGLSAFVGAIAVGDLVKTTLGPKGMDKILQSAYVIAMLSFALVADGLTDGGTAQQARSW